MDNVLLPGIASHRLLSNDEEVELAVRIESGDKEARDKLICANLCLVDKIASRYKGHGIPDKDLIQAGRVGLIEAADGFNYRKECRFSTYATYLIRKEIQKEVRRFRNLGFTKIPKHKISDIDSTSEHMVFNVTTVTLDSLIGDEHLEVTLGDCVEDYSVNIENDLINQESMRQLHEAMLTLPEREYEIIKLKSQGVKGIDIAMHLGISSPRVTQLYQSALKNLKAYLSDFN